MDPSTTVNFLEIQARRALDSSGEADFQYPAMRGFVPTPSKVVDSMVELLFEGRQPTAHSRVLDPGCGPGAFIDGVLRWCRRRELPTPPIVGVELSPERSREAARKFRDERRVTIQRADFLRDAAQHEQYDYVIGNPPYVSIGHLSESEKARYRAEYSAATGRFDLYMLFFEQALNMLRPGGRLVFITPEKFLYVGAAKSLRLQLTRYQVKALQLLDEATFTSHTTYPVVTVVEKTEGPTLTRVRLRDGSSRAVRLSAEGAPLLAALHGAASVPNEGPTLGDVCSRVSCGVATGADGIFVVPHDGLPHQLRRFAYPTIAGRQLRIGAAIKSTESMLLPYDARGDLLPEESLDELGHYLRAHRERLSERTCVLRKPWYAFHDSVPMADLMRPKILCKDIASTPEFWTDAGGGIIPRHSVYFIVPKVPELVNPLLAWLRGPEVREWLTARCPRAANGFLRLQSAVLKQVPVPKELALIVAA